MMRRGPGASGTGSGTFFQQLVQCTGVADLGPIYLATGGPCQKSDWLSPLTSETPDQIFHAINSQSLFAPDIS